MLVKFSETEAKDEKKIHYPTKIQKKRKNNEARQWVAKSAWRSWFLLLRPPEKQNYSVTLENHAPGTYSSILGPIEKRQNHIVWSIGHVTNACNTVSSSTPLRRQHKSTSILHLLRLLSTFFVKTFIDNTPKMKMHV